MIDDRIILFIILIALTYIFDHKILPQVGMVALALIEIYLGVTNPLVGAADVVYIFLFVINIMYTFFMILVAPLEPAEETQ